MAKVRQRTWTVPGQRTKRKARGFVTVGEDGKQIRVFSSDWSKEDAGKALSEHTLKIEQPKAKGTSITLAEAVERYLAAKSRKRSLAEDTRILGHLFVSRVRSGRCSTWCLGSGWSASPRVDTGG